MHLFLHWSKLNLFMFMHRCMPCHVLETGFSPGIALSAWIARGGFVCMESVVSWRLGIIRGILHPRIPKAHRPEASNPKACKCFRV